MHFSTFVIAAVAALAPMALANPVEARANDPYWTISHFSFCRGESSYDYSFNISAGAIGHTTAFTGYCSGTNGQQYLECDAKPLEDKFNLFAKTKIVKDPSNPNDTGVKLSIMTWYIANGCRYTNTGAEITYVAKCASKNGNAFVPIGPKQSKQCN